MWAGDGDIGLRASQEGMKGLPVLPLRAGDLSRQELPAGAVIECLEVVESLSGLISRHITTSGKGSGQGGPNGSVVLFL